MGSWLVEDYEDKKLQQSDLRESFSLDVVVVAFMNTEGPFCSISYELLSLLGQIKEYVCLRSPDPTLNFFIANNSTLILASDPINFYTEFG